MKEIKFRPLRFNKKLDKIVVSSYMQWHKVKCADYNQFKLLVDTSYHEMPDDALVYNHKGEQLFWSITHPDDIPVCDVRHTLDFDDYRRITEAFKQEHGTPYIIRGSTGDGYITGLLDCNGTPTFSHYTDNEIAIGYTNLDSIAKFEPLTVKVVKDWFGWFLYNLNNSRLFCIPLH